MKEINVVGVAFIKDGKLFTELKRESGESKKDFFNRIIQVVTLLGGEMDELI